MQWPQISSAIARVLVALILFASAVLKVTYSQPTPVNGRVGIGAFEDLMIRHEVLPAVIIPMTARMVVGTELLIALWLLTHWRPRAASLAALTLMLAFSTYLIMIYINNGDPTCGCFGVLSKEGLTQQLARNSVLLLLCGIGALWVGKHIPTPQHPPTISTTHAKES